MAEPFVTVSGIAAAFPQSNVDTDVIMPKQFLKGIDRSGLARGVFHDLRFDPAGAPRPGFVLNQAPWQEARFLIVGPNFGCGSSREHAVWGLLQLGIRALIGPSFAGIFFDNCRNNGLLTLTLEAERVAELAALAGGAGTAAMTIDLPSQTIAAAGGHICSFEIEAARKQALLGGLDPIGLTLQRADAVRSFERALAEREPWAFA